MVLFLGCWTEYFRWGLLGIARGLCLGGASRPGLDRVQTECFRCNFMQFARGFCVCIPRLCGRYRLWAFAW